MLHCWRIRALPAVVLLLATGCGGASTTQQLSQPAAAQPSPAAAAPPLADATVTPPAATSPPPEGPRLSPSPVTAEAQPNAAYAGTATAAPATPAAPLSPSPRRTPSPAAGTVTVTDGDSGSTVHLVPGQHLRVRISQGTWDPPESSDPGVVRRRTSSGGYPTDQPIDATFDAIGRGRAEVAAQSDAACFHTQPRCLMASRQWQVSVVVG